MSGPMPCCTLRRPACRCSWSKSTGGTESDDVLAAKFEKYRWFFRLKGKDHRGHDVPLWRSLYPSTGREGYPPLVVVFDPGTRLGEQALKNRMNRVMDLAREHWSGSYKNMGSHNQAPGGYYDYSDAIPLLKAAVAAGGLPLSHDRAALAGAVVREKLRATATATATAVRGRAYDVVAHQQAAMPEQLLALPAAEVEHDDQEPEADAGRRST
ncbi:hypothetical protein ABZ612_31530 [Streptomyces avermitilis]|uniref:hypothetical protein n=1 Tax=Streptomyces avermitilis TaxID=33903 RepID=UPI0033F0D27A